jgi:hypothetical protein
MPGGGRRCTGQVLKEAGVFFALLLAAQAHTAPAKLVIIPPGQPALTVDYPTIERCERARAELLRQDHEGDANKKELANQLGRPVIIKHVVAYCLPR